MKLLLLCLLFGAALALTGANELEENTEWKLDNLSRIEPNDLEENEDLKFDNLSRTELGDQDENGPLELESVESEPSDEPEAVDEAELTEPENQAGCVCRPHQWCRFRGRRYIYFRRSLTWSQAQRYCQRFGATLAAIHNRYVNNYLRNLAQRRPAWIGLTDGPNERYFLWINGYRWVYANWCRGEPNNKGNEDCVMINWSRGKCWNDFKCAARLPFICERK